MIDNRFIIALDFDGTIVEEAYPKIGELRKDARYYINLLHAEGFTIIINSCRTGKFEGDAYQFLQNEDIHFDYFNCNIPEMISSYGMDCRKISADVYIDDKNLGELPSWGVIYGMVWELYWKKYTKKTYRNIKRFFNEFIFNEETDIRPSYNLAISDSKGVISIGIVTYVSPDGKHVTVEPYTAKGHNKIDDHNLSAIVL